MTGLSLNLLLHPNFAQALSVLVRNRARPRRAASRHSQSVQPLWPLCRDPPLL